MMLFRTIAILQAVTVVAASMFPASTAAQIGATTDILTGTVRRAEGNLPIENAQIEVLSLESNITRRARTNAQGKYTILFPDGGGQYQVTARAIGLAPQTATVARIGDEDRLVHDFLLTTNPTVLAGVQIRARQDAPRDRDQPTPGSVERAINTDQAARLPIDASDLLQLALLAPGVVSISGTDSSAASFSVGGLGPGANNITLDGLSFGASQVPQEALRNTRVQTSTFDVSRGQFSGGLVSSTTRSGSNNPQGNFSYSLRDRDLAIEGEDPSPAAQGFTQNQVSGGFGGPIVRDKLFWFGSLQLRRRNDVLTSLSNSDAATLERYGVSPDSVDRFTGLLSARGLSPFTIAADNRLSDNASGLLRLDYLTDGGHSITVRGDYRWSDQDPSRIGPLALPQSGGENGSWGGGIMSTITSNFAGRFLNELKVYTATDRSSGTPFLTIPAGRVQVRSNLPEQQSGIATLTFGGNTGLPQEGRDNTVEITNEVSWIAGGHRLRLGVLVNRQSFRQDVTTNRWGTYVFNSLADFETGQAASYTRTLTPRLREGLGTNASVFVGDVWRVNRAWQLTYGARLEGSSFGKTPAFNPEVETKFGYRTNHVPTDIQLSPRFGFTWNVGLREQGRPTPPLFTIRGGLGEFRSAPSTGLVASAAGATGLPDNESQLICIGPLVPAPNWASFSGDAGTIPTRCLDGGNQFVPTNRPNVTVFGDDFSASRAWRGTLGISRRFWERYNLSADASWSRGVAQTGYRDANLRPSPSFTLSNEGGRPVFVPASTIVPGTGASSLLASRQDAAFGQVLVTRSDLRSLSRQATISLGGLTRRGINFNASYTWAHARDQGSGGGGGGRGGGGASFGGPTTAGDPNVLEWSTSSFQRRHSIVGSVNYPVNLGWEVTMFGRLTSGSPFTPMVNADVNGDGSRNDRAFLFDPMTTADTALAATMRDLLRTVPADVRACLTNQLGAVARRNSCEGPWQPSVDLQVNWRPNFWGLERRLAVSFLTVNAVGGLDRLLHGKDNLRGWGQFRDQDNTLLYVRGFDPSTSTFRYEVNQRFGARRNGANAIPVPFQIGIQARYTAGPDRMREMIAGMIRGGRGGAGGGFGEGRGGSGGQRGGEGRGLADGGPGGGLPGLGGSNFNPVAALLQLKDSLQLTTEQVTQLQPLADSVTKRNSALGEEARKLMQDAGANPDMGAVMGRLQPRLQQLQRENEALVKRLEQILTAEQWAKVPPRIRNAGRGPAAGGAPRRPGSGER